MKVNAYSIYDSAAGAYNTPFFMHNDAMAIRAFQDNANDNESMISKHPSQFTLFKVGEYNDEDGVFTLLVPHKALGDALTYKDDAEVQITVVEKELNDIKKILLGDKPLNALKEVN
jgi:hypothetical protein